jgi:hypothetical protein
MSGADSAFEEERRMRIVLADDREDVRILMRAVVELDGRFEVVAEADDGATASCRRSRRSTRWQRWSPCRLRASAPIST